MPILPKEDPEANRFKRHAKKKHPSRDLMADVVLPQVEPDNRDDNGNETMAMGMVSRLSEPQRMLLFGQ